MKPRAPPRSASPELARNDLSNVTVDPTRLELGAIVYRLTPLRSRSPSDPILGALVLPNTVSIPFPVIQTVAERLDVSLRSPRDG